MSATDASAASQSPSARNETVVAPLFAGFAPAAGASTKDRKPSPQPPPTATVESSVSTKYGAGLSGVVVVVGAAASETAADAHRAQRTAAGEKSMAVCF